MKSHPIFRFIVLAVIAVALISCATSQTRESRTEATPTNEDKITAQQLTDAAQLTFQNFMTDPNMEAMREKLKDARGIFIMPQQLKAAFIIGASGGSGVLLVRDAHTNNWRGPAFYTVGGASFGLQAGGQAAEVILLVMTDRGVAAFQSNNFKLGVDAGVAAGPMGIGLAASSANLSADILSYSRAKGLYGGVSLDGAVVAARGALAKAYYGKNVSTSDILVKGVGEPPQAQKLIAEVDRSSRASRETGTTPKATK